MGGGGVEARHGIGTLRGRLGATITPDMLVYATGGLAYGVIEHLGQINGFANGFDAQGNPAVVSAAMDMLFRDDECRIRTHHAPANFTTLKHMAHNLIRKAPGKDSLRLKRKVAAWDDDFLASLIAA